MFIQDVFFFHEHPYVAAARRRSDNFVAKMLSQSS